MSKKSTKNEYKFERREERVLNGKEQHVNRVHWQKHRI